MEVVDFIYTHILLSWNSITWLHVSPQWLGMKLNNALRMKVRNKDIISGFTCILKKKWYKLLFRGKAPVKTCLSWQKTDIYLTFSKNHLATMWINTVSWAIWINSDRSVKFHFNVQIKLSLQNYTIYFKPSISVHLWFYWLVFHASKILICISEDLNH